MLIQVLKSKFKNSEVSTQNVRCLRAHIRARMQEWDISKKRQYKVIKRTRYK